MDDKQLLCLERCGFCSSLFALCRPCFRGQGYCDDACRSPARAAQKQQARARHQASPLGRKDHRDRNRDWRLRKRAATEAGVMDQGSEKLATPGSVWPPVDAISPMDGVLIIGEKPHADASTIRDPEDESALDESPGEPGRRRGAQGGAADSVDTAAHPSTAAPAGVAGALAPGAGARCAVCGRAGRVVSAWPPRWAR